MIAVTSITPNFEKMCQLNTLVQRYVDAIVKYTGKPTDVVRKDVGRNRYFNPRQAKEYGLIDHVMEKKKASNVISKRDYEGDLRRSEASNPRRDSGSGPEAGSDF